MKQYMLMILCSFLIMHSPELNSSKTTMNQQQKNLITDIYYLLKGTFNKIKEVLLGIPASFLQETFFNHPYQHIKASVRLTEEDALSPDEQAYIHTRLPLIQKSLQTMLDTLVPEHKIPCIAFCCSGGGFRSMIFTLGCLKGAQKIGLLDASMYMVGLSGSTWAIAPWIASGKNLDEYQERLGRKIKHGLRHLYKPHHLKDLIDVLLAKVAYGQFLSAIDIYGGLLANTLLTDFKEHRLQITLTETHQAIKTGAYPLPIYSAICTNIEPYEWFEVTPFEVGSTYLQSYVPTWAYGRKFKHGSSRNTAPEQTLGYMMGIFGSAFEVDVEDIVRITSNRINAFKDHLPEFMQKPVEMCIEAIVNSALDDVRLLPSMLRNYSYKMNHSPLKKDKKLSLVDAGIDFNLPFPPLLRKQRKVDIIIACDASSDVYNAPQLQKAEAYARRKGLPFPHIDYDAINEQIINILKRGNLEIPLFVLRSQDDPACPVILYFPRVANPNYPTFDPEECLSSGPCGTFNFDYPQEEFNGLVGLAEHGIQQHEEAIKEIIRQVVTRK